MIRRSKSRIASIAMVLLATSACSAVAASSALAAPEFIPVPQRPFPIPLTSEGGVGIVRFAVPIEHLSSSGNGELTGPTSGTVTEKLKEMGWGGLPCTSVGQPAGTVQTHQLHSSLVWLDKAHTSPGVLLEPEEGNMFAKFNCGGIVAAEVTGSVIGVVALPELGIVSGEQLQVFESTTGEGTVQKYTQIEEEGPVHQLSISINGGSPEPFAWETALTLEYSEGVEGAIG